MRKLRINLKALAPWVILITIVATRLTGIWGTFMVSGESMMPNYVDGQLLLGSNLRLSDGIDRYDVVFVNAPDGEKVIKRVIGLPNDKIRIDDGIVYVNDNKLDEPYLDNAHTTLTYNMEEIKLGNNELFIMGDNRDNSLDSRFYGPIDLNSIISQPLW